MGYKMKISMISFSWTGCRLADGIRRELEACSYEVKCYRKSKYAEKRQEEFVCRKEAENLPEESIGREAAESVCQKGVQILENVKIFPEPVTESVKEWTGEICRFPPVRASWRSQ